MSRQTGPGGAYRAVVRTVRRPAEGGHIFTDTYHGPFVTKGAAKAAVTREKPRNNFVTGWVEVADNWRDAE